MTDAFSMVNKSLVESLESLIDLIYSPGIINIDFADLKAILSGIGNSAFLNTIEESGKDRAEKICHRILQNPLLQNNNFEVEKILLNIAGSSNLSMLEVEKISKKVGDLNPKSKIIFGISKNQKLKNKVKTTILMTGGGSTLKEFVQEVVTPVVVEIKKPEVFAAKEEKKVEVKKAPIKKEVVKAKAKVALPVKKQKPKLPVQVLKIPVTEPVLLEERRLPVIELTPQPAKTTIRRSGLEIRKAEELEEKKRQDQEKEWEIPAFLRKVKYKS